MPFDLSFTHLLVILSAIISICGASVYIRNTASGKTKPNLISWSMWTLAPLIGTGAAISAGADIWATVRIFLAGFLPLLVCLAAFTNKLSYWKLSKFDFICGICSLIALGMWLLADSPRMAVLLAAAGDSFATIPTIRKAWNYPETETGLTYIASLISVLIVLPSIPTWNIENASFQVVLVVANSLLVLAVYKKRFGLG